MDNESGVPKAIPLYLLEEITNGFSMQRKLGGGAYGNVYLGEYKDGKKIAVKVLKDGLDVEDEKFEKEYHNLASLHHKNIVQIVGYCHETKKECLPHKGKMVFAENTKRALCFEFVHNGSLDNFIYDESNRHDWRTRYAIIKGICEGLEYLHEKLKPPMYHLDLKPANILLDENLSPKIADFGLSKFFIEEKTKRTQSAIGTPGYVPPEYIDAGLISIKFDIFSLGVMIINIMTGQNGYFRIAEMSSQQFVEHVHTDWMNRLQGTSAHTYSIQVRRCIEIALSCVEADRHKRPNIGVIINNLNKTEPTIQISGALRNDTGSSNQILDALRNGIVNNPNNRESTIQFSGALRNDTGSSNRILYALINGIVNNLNKTESPIIQISGASRNDTGSSNHILDALRNGIVNNPNKTESTIQFSGSLMNDTGPSDKILDALINGIGNNLNKTESTIQISGASRNDTGSSNHILDALRNAFGSSTNQICPCIFNAAEMLYILRNKLISYTLGVTDNRGRVHEATIETLGHDKSTFEYWVSSIGHPAKPKIKIIDCTEGLGGAHWIDVHSTMPWILVSHLLGQVSIWNYQIQTRVMVFHDMAETKSVRPAKFIEPLQCVLVGDFLGDIHVYSYVKMDRLQKFRGHTECVTSLAIHPSEPLLLSASHDKLIKLWNWEAGWQCIRTFKGHSNGLCLVKFNPQTAGSTFTSSSFDSTIKIWNIHHSSPVATLNCSSKIYLDILTNFDYFNPSGDRWYLVAGYRAGHGQLWDLQTHSVIKEIRGFQRRGCNIAVVEGLRGRPIMLTVSDDYTVAFCDSTSHRYDNRVMFNLGQVMDFAYINMTKSLAIGCLGGIAIMEIN